MLRTPSTPPQVTTRRQAAVVGGVGSSHDDVRNGVWGWPKRRQDSEQQPARGSPLGRIDQLFPLPFLSFCDGSSRRALRSKQRTRMYNDVVWSLNCFLGLLRGDLYPAIPRDRRGMMWQLACTVWSSRHRRQLKRLVRRRLSGSCSEAEESTRWTPWVWISRQSVRT